MLCKCGTKLHGEMRALALLLGGVPLLLLAGSRHEEGEEKGT